MKNQKSEINNDLLELFEHFDSIFSTNNKRSAEEIAAGVDFKVFSEYYISDISDILKNLENADDNYLLLTCKHMYNIMDWIRLIVENRSQSFSDAFEAVFNDKFGDPHILQNIYDQCLSGWIRDKSGQHEIGLNIYSVLESKIYYRDRFKQWHSVDVTTAFDIRPTMQQINDRNIVSLLDDGYKDTWYDEIINQWDGKQYDGVLQANFMRYDEAETTPEAYFDFTYPQIKNLLKNPVSIPELERWYGGTITDLENTIKLLSVALNTVKKIRNKDSLTIYLLRDCLVFYEIHKTLDILTSEETESDQLLIGRKLLSNKPDQWGYYIVILEVLYDAHYRFPEDFKQFYDEFSRHLDLFASINPGFKSLLADLATYIKNHSHTKNDKIVVFDAGFQGSINLFVKYIIDRHINSQDPHAHIMTDIKVGVGAEWSLKMFGDRAESDYFPYLNRIQQLARSDELYHYKFGSLNSGSVMVNMGEKSWQKKAAVDLVVLVMITQLSYSVK